MDDFYNLTRPTLAKIKDIFTWGHKEALRTDVDMLNCKINIHRTKADKSFEQVLKFINKRSSGFFRMIHRKKWNSFGILSDIFKEMDILELFIRSIDIGETEYFIFMYLPVEKLSYLIEKYSFHKL